MPSPLLLSHEWGGTLADRCPHRYIEKFYGMRSQLQKISLRLQVRQRWPDDQKEESIG